MNARAFCQHGGRQVAKKELVEIFKDSFIINDEVEVLIIGPRGREEVGRGVGVIRDMLSLFWKEVYESVLIGEDQGAPFVRHVYHREEWAAFGGILSLFAHPYI